MDKCCLLIYQASDSATVALSKVLNLRLSTVRELFKTLVTIHVNINNSRSGSEYRVADKSDPGPGLLPDPGNDDFQLLVKK